MSTERATGIESTGPTIDELANQLTHLQRQSNALEAEQERTEIRHQSELEALRSELEATREQQRQDRHALARENHQLRKSQQQAEKRADQAEAERDELKQQLDPTENDDHSRETQEQDERITHLEAQLADAQDHAGREFATVRARITDTEDTVEDLEAQIMELEGGFDDATPRVEGEKNGSQDAETPLERICRLPEHLAERELTANQERARFIARDLQDYTEKCPAGLVIDSRAIKRVITAKEGKKPHTQTVARVMEFLDDLGKDAVELTKRRGRKLISVDPEVAAQLTRHTRCDRGPSPSTAETVISG